MGVGGWGAQIRFEYLFSCPVVLSRVGIRKYKQHAEVQATRKNGIPEQNYCCTVSEKVVSCKSSVWFSTHTQKKYLFFQSSLQHINPRHTSRHLFFSLNCILESLKHSKSRLLSSAVQVQPMLVLLCLSIHLNVNIACLFISSEFSSI